MSIKAQIDNILIDASPRKPKPQPPLPGDASLSADLNIGPTHKELLCGDYNHLIHSHSGKGPFFNPTEAGALDTVNEVVDAVTARI